MTPPAPPLAPSIVELYGDILAAGAVLGDYAVEGLAFEGGFASIYRGRHRGSGGPVAIKVLRSALAMSVRMIERFEQEARALERLHHPGIVVIHELGALSDGRPYIVMEWIEGRSLAEELAARGPLSAAEALAVMNEVGSAVAAAHAVGVIHRDIKAQNIVTLQQGAWFTVKLIDFGIAKLMAPEDQNTAFTTRTMVGTPRTMAPEQILGRSVDARTDVYALGLLLYQMLAGRLPFDGANAVEIEELHLFAAPPQVSQVAPVPAALDEVLARALAKEKADRYPDVPAFLDALARAVDGNATLPAPAGRVTRAGIGLLVELPLDAGGHGDAEDRVLAVVDDAVAALDLRVAVETAHMLLAVAPLPESRADQARLRADLLTEALRIRATAERVLPGAGAGAVVAVRTGAIEIIAAVVDPVGDAAAPTGARTVVGGALLGDEPWAACRGVAGVVADIGALSGIEERVRATPLSGQPGLCVVHEPVVHQMS
jgi:eukaryotic-like serine/threonine-protein kinase